MKQRSKSNFKNAICNDNIQPLEKLQPYMIDGKVVANIPEVKYYETTYKGKL